MMQMRCIEAQLDILTRIVEIIGTYHGELITRLELNMVMKYATEN